MDPETETFGRICEGDVPLSEPWLALLALTTLVMVAGTVSSLAADAVGSPAAAECCSAEDDADDGRTTSLAAAPAAVAAL